jgi:hypothetical protein
VFRLGRAAAKSVSLYKKFFLSLLYKKQNKHSMNNSSNHYEEHEPNFPMQVDWTADSTAPLPAQHSD